MHNMKIARITKKLTQKELAEKLGLGVSIICEYETGKKSPKATVLKKICKELEVSADYLLEMED